MVKSAWAFGGFQVKTGEWVTLKPGTYEMRAKFNTMGLAKFIKKSRDVPENPVLCSLVSEPVKVTISGPTESKVKK